MNTVVLDASVAVAWIAPGQITNAALDLLNDDAVVFTAPFLFPAEVRNALLKLERNGRCSPAETERGLALIETLELEPQRPLSAVESQAVLTLAREEMLSFYDALYLDLAAKIGGVLASRDQKLLSAAVRRGVRTWALE